jgi:hypothetical protein
VRATVALVDTRTTATAGAASNRRAVVSVAAGAGPLPPAENDAGSACLSQAAQQLAEVSAEWPPAGQQGEAAWHAVSARPGGGHGHDSQRPKLTARVVHIAAARRVQFGITVPREAILVPPGSRE